MARTAPQKFVGISQEPLPSRPWEQVSPRIAAALRPYVPQARDAIIEAIRAEVPAYARPLEGAFGAGVRVGVEQALEEFVSLVEDPGHDRSQGRDVYVALGRGEAREGRSLEALLAAYRVGARVAWRQIAEGARREGLDSESLALLAESIFAYIDELSAYSAEGYAQEQALVAAESDRLRRDLVRLMIDARGADPGAIEAAARDAGWRLPGSLAVLVWRQGRRRVAPRLPDGTIVAPVDGLECAVVPDPAGPGRRRQIEAALDGGPAALGPEVGWPDAARSAARAFAARRLSERGLIGAEGLVLADEHLAELVVGGDQALLEDLLARALAPLDGETPRSRERLTETLSAWLEHQGAVGATAKALHVHPQTVRYRLGRLRELFGERLDDPSARFELSLAVRAGSARVSEPSPGASWKRESKVRKGSR